MLKIIPLLLIFILSSAYAKIVTDYVWVKNKDQFFYGKCYEIDTETKGKKYRSVVKQENCIPKETIYYFLKQEGKCFLVDALTNGKKFANKTDIKNCRPKDTIKIFAQFRGKHGCYEVDQESNGKKYFRILPITDCDSKNKEYLFKLGKKHEGTCYAKESNEVIKVRTDLCRPKNPTHKYYRTAPLKGYCYEQDIRGEKFYSKKTDITLCRPKNTIYVFYTDPKNNNSKCYELDETTKGDDYLNIVRDEKCKN